MFARRAYAELFSHSRAHVYVSLIEPHSATRPRAHSPTPAAHEAQSAQSHPSRSASMAKFAHVRKEEEELMKAWHSDGVGVRAIAKRLRRSTDTVSKHLFKKHKRNPKPVGRPRAIAPKTFTKVQKTYEKAIANAGAKHEVTANMVKRRMRLKCSTKTLRRALWAHGVRFRPLYEKPTLSDGDKRDRLEWAKAHASRSGRQWDKYLHAIIDNKTFQVYPNGKMRDYAARRRVRGAYRGRGAKLTKGYTKPAKQLKQNTGAKAVQITCAIGNGKVLMWREVHGQWNGSEAAAMYAGALKKSLEDEYPEVRGTWRVMEDNDPSGYSCSKGRDAKKESGIAAFKLPPRSPDLNPLDFSVWSEINRRMRTQESKWPAGKTETRRQHLQRLKRTALALPEAFIRKVVANLEERCKRLVEAKGGHFAEGGSGGSE